jgi:hypothetical protein
MRAGRGASQEEFDPTILCRLSLRERTFFGGYARNAIELAVRRRLDALNLGVIGFGPEAVAIACAQLGWRLRRYRNLAAWHQQQADLFTARAYPLHFRVKNVLTGLQLSTNLSPGSRDAIAPNEVWSFIDVGEPSRLALSTTLSPEDLRLAEDELKLAQTEQGAVEDPFRVARYHRELSRKYERAAARTWLVLPPDPAPTGP